MFELSKTDMPIVEKLKDTHYDIFIDLGEFAGVSFNIQTIDKATIVKFILQYKSDLNVFNMYTCNKLHETKDILDYTWVESLLNRYNDLLIELNIFENHHNYGLNSEDTVLFKDFYTLMMNLCNNSKGIGNGAKGYKLAEYRWSTIANSLGLNRKIGGTYV